MSRRSKPSRFWPLVAVVVLLFLVNLPMGHFWWTNHRLDADGEVATATVRHAKALGTRHYVDFQLPAEVDPDRTTYSAEVTEAAYDRATRTDTIEVTYLPGKPATNRAVGYRPPGRVGLLLTLLADLAILGMLFLMFWARRHDVLEIVATKDVERCKPDDTIEDLPDGQVLVRGDVQEIEDDHLLMLSGGRKVRVVLAGFDNPVGHQQPAQAQGRRVPRR
ncbi:hypothetical protein ncot_00230 [Nocardioides sp. JQ2195]|uniref:hypothetical protein n=1 Tax=Nocardioides sp. JQ2195 TaxID=2592334 RepID=UPI00143E9C0E|nr:hypothetical protein [Nocardioides sp. JQ2195]QIX25185.1 hypothetical protein ncot_00230 [Nocardioides sp. JQ2195]